MYVLRDTGCGVKGNRSPHGIARASSVGGTRLTAEQPSPQSLRRLEHEYSLAVEPLSNLMASSQIHRGDRMRVTHREGSPFLMFFREAEALEGWEVAAR